MKAAIVLAGLLLAGGAQAQLADLNGDLLSVPGAKPKDEFDRFFRPERPNEITRGRVTYSGVFVQMFKIKNPLELANPFAPAQAGLSEHNVARDAISGRSRGFKLLALSF